MLLKSNETGSCDGSDDGGHDDEHEYGVGAGCYLSLLILLFAAAAADAVVVIPVAQECVHWIQLVGKHV